MKNLIIILIILFAALLQPYDSFSRGMSGNYIITGIALSQNGDTLRNEKLAIDVNGKIDTLITNSHGIYWAEIRWSTACPSGITKLKRERLTKKYNPKYIYFTYKNSTIKIKNNWKKYISTNYPNSLENTKNEKLQF